MSGLSVLPYDKPQTLESEQCHVYTPLLFSLFLFQPWRLNQTFSRVFLLYSVSIFSYFCDPLDKGHITSGSTNHVIHLTYSPSKCPLLLSSLNLFSCLSSPLLFPPVLPTLLFFSSLPATILLSPPYLLLTSSPLSLLSLFTPRISSPSFRFSSLLSSPYPYPVPADIHPQS